MKEFNKNRIEILSELYKQNKGVNGFGCMRDGLLKTLDAIAYCESSWNPDAVGDVSVDYPEGYSHGAFQCCRKKSPLNVQCSEAITRYNLQYGSIAKIISDSDYLSILNSQNNVISESSNWIRLHRLNWQVGPFALKHYVENHSKDELKRSTLTSIIHWMEIRKCNKHALLDGQARLDRYLMFQVSEFEDALKFAISKIETDQGKDK